MERTNKNTQKQLFTAIAMLLVAAISLGTATYAWFMNTATANVDPLDLQASAAMNMELTLAKPGSGWLTNGGFNDLEQPGADYSGWKMRISKNDLLAFHNISVPSHSSFGALRPSSSVEMVVTSGGAKVGDFFVEEEWGDGVDSNPYAVTFSAVTRFIAGDGGAPTTSALLYIPLYIRASENMNVYFTSIGGLQSDPYYFVKERDPNGEILKAMRIGIVPYTSQGAVGTPVIIEPDSRALDLGNKNTTRDSSFANGDAIKSLKTNPGIIDQTGTQNTTTGTAIQNYFVNDPNGDGIIDVSEQATVTAGKTPIIRLDAADADKMLGQRIDIFIWLEGCDYDCITKIAKQNFMAAFNFIGAPTTTP